MGEEAHQSCPSNHRNCLKSYLGAPEPAMQAFASRARDWKGYYASLVRKVARSYACMIMETKGAITHLEQGYPFVETVDI